MLRRSLLAAVVLASLAMPAVGANLPLLSGPQDPSQLTAVINTLIRSINTGIGGLLNAQTASVGTTAVTTEEILQQYVLPANTITAAGQGVRVTCWGATGATANNKTMRLYFGALVIATPTAGTNAGTWSLTYDIMRKTAATQGYNAGGVVNLTPVAQVTADGTDNFAADVTIKCTGQNGTAAANDIIARGMIVELIK